MKRKGALLGWLDPALGSRPEPFTLSDLGEKPESERAVRHVTDVRSRTEGLLTRIEHLLQSAGQGKDAVEEAGDLSHRLDENVQRLEQLFRLPRNKDVVIREFRLATRPPARAVVIFLDGISDKQVINESILEPLMLLSHLDHHLAEGAEGGPARPAVKPVLERLLPGHQVQKFYTLAEAAEAILSGDTVVMIDGDRGAISVETKSPPSRSVSEPQVERVIMGPHDAFNESFRTNTGLVRRRLKDPRLVTEIMTVGELGKSLVALMYVDGLTSPKLIAEVRRRIEAVKVDMLGGVTILQQYITDAPSALLPGELVTERPDRAAAYLSEGHVVVLVDGSPNALVLPVTFWSLLQTAEDYFLPFPFGTALRYARLGALIFVLVVPSIYIAVVNYHQEMLPTELMLFIAATREAVPMPAVVELLLMEVSFELIREAGTRIPGVIGPTIGLVAALVLGNAAVEARLVSPVMIVIVAITGLASFAIPNYIAGFGIRIIRFLLLGAVMTLGFYGLGAGLFILTVYLAGARSFGVPYLAPVVPRSAGTTDVFNRPQLFQMELRPAYTRPLDRRRQAPVLRPWDPFNREADQTDQQGGGGP